MKVGKVEISDQFFAKKEEFDVDKAFNGKIKHIFGKMVDRKLKGAKEFYRLKGVWDRVEEKSSKAGQAWVDIFFD
ncbi:hypothetical protein Hanom_Chr12g01104041 [Helianthus anomalus]